MKRKITLQFYFYYLKIKIFKQFIYILKVELPFLKTAATILTNGISKHTVKANPIITIMNKSAKAE